MSRGQMRHLSKPLKTFCVFHRFFALPSNWLASLCVSVHGMPGCREGKTGRRGSWIEMWLCCCQALPHELPFSFSTRTERRSVKGVEEEEGGGRGGRRRRREGEGERESERDTLHLSSSGLIGVAKPIHISSGVPITQTPYTKPPLLLHHPPTPSSPPVSCQSSAACTSCRCFELRASSSWIMGAVMTLSQGL